jgi:hypothetical protein
LSLTYFTTWRLFGSLFLPFFLPHPSTLRDGYNIGISSLILMLFYRQSR